MRYYSILFLLGLWHIAVMTNLKTTVNTIANIAAVILALIYPNGEFIPPYNHPSLRQAFWARRPEGDQCDIQLCWPAVVSSVQHRWTSHHFIPGGKARQALAVIGKGLHNKGRSNNLSLGLHTGGVRVLRPGSGSKRGGLGTFGEMIQAVMLVKGGRVSWKPSWKDWGSPVTHYALENWESYKSTWKPVERVQSNKKSCDQAHVTEGQEIFLRILAENVAGVQRNGRWHSTCAQVPWINLTSCSAGLKWRAPSSTDGLSITSYLAERCDKLWESQVKACLTKGRVTTFDLASLLEGSRVPLLGSGSKRGGLGPFVEMSQAVMPVIEPGMFVLYFPVCQA